MISKKQVSLKKRGKKNKSKILLAMILVLLLTVNSYSSLHMGKGEIYKSVSWQTEEPIIDAKVGLDVDGDEIVDIFAYTDSFGIAHFQDLPYGTYYIYVDIDDDGIWETIAEEVIVDGTEYVYNNYIPLPEMWRLGVCRGCRDEVNV